MFESACERVWEVDLESRGRKAIVYVDFLKRHFFSGALVAIGEKKNLTQERFIELNKVDVSQIAAWERLSHGWSKGQNSGDCLYRPWLTLLFKTSSGDEEDHRREERYCLLFNSVSPQESTPGLWEVKVYPLRKVPRVTWRGFWKEADTQTKMRDFSRRWKYKTCSKN